MSLQILIAETEQLLSDLLGEQIRRTFPASTTTCVRTLGELQASRDVHFDLAVVDLVLNDGDVLAWLGSRMEAHPQGKVTVLTSLAKDYLLHHVFRSAVAGIVHKADGLECLEMALKTVLAGGSYYSPRIQDIRTRQHADQQHFAHILSLREQAVLKLIGAGASAEIIARQLGIRVNTVADHRKNLMHKLGIHSRAELITYALEKGFADLSKKTRGSRA